MKLSVVIPTHNRPEVLLRTLRALAEQTLERERFEVVVVDDGSTEPNRETIRGFEAPYEYRLVEKPQGGLASARNVGADQARGEYLHFMDDDVLPHPDLLRQHLESHEAAQEETAVVGALPYPLEVKMNTFLWYLEQSGHYDLYKHPRKYPGGKPPMPPLNGNSSLPRELFFRIGKYDETFRRYGSEDLDLGYRLDQAGVRFLYNPQAIGYHDHIKKFDQFCIDMETAGESLIQLYHKHPAIKSSKKIDLLEDPLRSLPGKKKLIKIIMTLTLRAPWLLALPRVVVRLAGPFYALRRPLFPFYRWISYYHYAVGMQRGLSATP